MWENSLLLLIIVSFVSLTFATIRKLTKMTSEKQKNAPGCSDLGNDLLFLQSVLGLHLKHLIAFYVSSAGNTKMILT